MPALMEMLPDGEDIASASPQFVLHTRTQHSDLSPKTTYSVVRVSDGQTVRSFQSSGGDATALEPRLVGTSLVQLVEPDDIQRRVEVRDAATGSLQRTIDTTGRTLLHAEPTWAMVNSVGAGTGQNTVRFVRADGSLSTVPGNFPNPPQWVGGDSDTAYVVASDVDYAIDVATGARTELVFPDEGRLYAISPTHLIATAATASGDLGFRTLTLPGLQPGWSVDVPTDYRDRGFVPYGEGLAQLSLPNGATSSQYKSLRPVDLATGDLRAPVADDVFQAVPMTDGRTALVLADTPGGRIAVATGTGTTVVPLTDLPDVRERSLGLGFSGERVVASWARRDGVWSIPADGSQAWSPAYADPGFTNNDHDKRVSYAGDVAMTENDEVNRTASRFRLMWPGGSRDILGTTAFLGHGGIYVERLDYRPSGGLVEVSEVRTGAVVASYPGYGLRLIDGTRIWSQPNSAATMQSTDLAGLDPPEQAQLPAACANGQVRDVRSGWAVVRCGNQTLVVDLRSDLPAYTLPAEAVGAVLGGGFVASSFVADSAPSSPVYVEVTELATQQSRTYGPVRALAVNDNAAPELVYADPASQVRRVSLDWMTDVRGPHLTGSPQVPAAVSSTSTRALSLSWSYAEATSYDIRRGDRTGATWTLPEAWQGLSTASVTTSIAPGTGACLSARARDAVGRLSPWSQSVCQYVDGGAPVLQSPPSIPAAVASTTTRSVALTWTYADPSSGLPGAESIASYDVRRGDRTATSWTAPTPWQGLPNGSVTASIEPGSGACFSSRARDAAGNTSAWSGPVCQYVDGVAPRITSTAGSVAYPTVLRANVSHNAEATDNERVVSYDVEMALAPRNSRLGAWTRVVNARPSARFTTGAQQPGSAICMRSRARDAAGNLSAWSSARCTTAPVDDREFAKTGRTQSVTASGGIGGGYLRLVKKGSTATLSAQTGRTVGVWIRRGPKLGKADVYAGLRRIGRINFRSPITRNALVLLPVAGGFSGNVKLVSLGRTPAHIDGIVVVR